MAVAYFWKRNAGVGPRDLVVVMPIAPINRDCVAVTRRTFPAVGAVYFGSGSSHPSPELLPMRIWDS